jgi:glucosylceramidase
MQEQTRRELLKFTSAAAGLAMTRGKAVAATSPKGEISVRVTAGSQRFASVESLRWRTVSSKSNPAIAIDPDKTYQEILGFGAALTDAACYTLSQLPEEARSELLQDFFHPSKMGLQVCRICIGASDYARNAYSFDEGDPDPEMKRFSIEHDQQYILPLLRSIRQVNPNLFLLASPWSPPGWMKPNSSMLGGCIHPVSFPAYARYFTRFLQAYAEAGVPVQAVTIQNEVDTEQNGRMPACLFSQEQEVGFVAEHLGPAFEQNKLSTKIWIIDHNYNLWGRAICELEDPRVRQYVDGVAWHGYVGEPSAMTKVHDAFPDKHTYWTEGGPAYTDPHYGTDWAKWGATYAGILNNWARCIIGWNLALDEVGKPNIGPFTCGGVVTVHSSTNEISRSGQYWAFAHYANAFRPGAKRVHSTSSISGVSHVTARNTDGTTALILTNSAASQNVTIRAAGSEAEVSLPEDSIVNLTWHA